MIQIFGLFFLIILISLIYLAYSGRIHSNIPLIFMFFILIASPFIYLGNKSGVDFESFSNWDNTMRSPLSIFYTNTKDNQPGTRNNCDECPGICNYNEDNVNVTSIAPILKIDNPVQSRMRNIPLGTINFVAIACPYYGNSYYYATLNKSNNNKNITVNAGTNAVTLQIIPVNKLIDFNNDNNNGDFFEPKLLQNTNADVVVDILNEFDDAPSQSYLILSSVGEGMDGLVAANNNSPVNYNNTTVNSITLIEKLKQKYKLNYISQLRKKDSFISIIFKKNSNEYISINQMKATDTCSELVQNLLTKGKTAVLEQSGQTFKDEKPENTILTAYARPFVSAQFNIISPVKTKSDTSLCFSSENNKSFVFLAPKTDPNDTISLYSKSPSLDYGPVSATWLINHQPQNWTIDPINNSGITTEFYIRTYSKPHYYLELKPGEPEPTISVNMYKGGINQHWTIKGTAATNYTIQHHATGLYLAYSNFGGYLYDDNASVITSKSDKYKWKLLPSIDTKQIINEKKINYENDLLEIQSPTDFGNESKPSFTLSRTINGRRIDLSSKGRTYWNEYYTQVWNGRWIYYGTIATYGQFKNNQKTKFLEINLNKNGEGTLTDKYFNHSINVKNIGSNVIFGTINQGPLNGMTAYLEMIDEPLRYTNPSQSYPVKMRYLVFDSNDNIFNLSTGNFKNLEGYSSKFDGNFLVLSNFLEASGVPMDMALALPKRVNLSDIPPNIPNDSECRNGNRCEFANNQVLLGCGNGMNDDYVCNNARTKKDRIRNNLKDWAACPYQCDMKNGKCLGDWRWQPEFSSDGTATKCNPPADGSNGYKQNIAYSPEYYLQNKN